MSPARFLLAVSAAIAAQVPAQVRCQVVDPAQSQAPSQAAAPVPGEAAAEETAQASASPSTQEGSTLSVAPDDVSTFEWRDNRDVLAFMTEARRFKESGQNLRAFRMLLLAAGPGEPDEDQPFGLPEMDEERLFQSLGHIPCAEGYSRMCVFANDQLVVPERPAPASLQDLALERRNDHDQPQPFLNWQQVGPAGRDIIDTWTAQAARPEPFACEGNHCLQLFVVSRNAVDGGGTRAGIVDISDAVTARASMALCSVERVDTVIGPPEHCSAVLAEGGGAIYAVHLMARDRRHDPGAAPPPTGPPREPLLTVGLAGLTGQWLTNQIMQALARPSLTLRTVLPEPLVVTAGTGFRRSPVFVSPQLRESGIFRIGVSASPVGFQIRVWSVLSLTYGNVPTEVSQARPDQVFRYESEIRGALLGWLRTACEGRCTLPPA
jgi:hypothetical protein